MDGPWGRYLWYRYDLSRLANGRDKSLSNRSVENCSQWLTEIRCKITQEPIWEAVRPTSFKYLYACKAVYNVYGINHKVRTLVIVKLS